ncbi:acetyl-CoA synthetase-like protein [Melanomma pulvis-pyrius CBS 109.77]|uniref:Acetyl-CoA synthetase-like protein n=1 Tax=Melanomma pulvis-pyrius CBS 109.77 TaxID=1314802 RepID=A0A6A6XXS5_9PLEO|nr:acetyl-CoA synthetase-like protein [Melanomma pulvis-pyrius CBS 109.77]
MGQNIIYPVSQRAKLFPSETAIVYGERSITYCDFQTAVKALSMFNIQAIYYTRCQELRFRPSTRNTMHRGIASFLAVLATCACYIPMSAESWSTNRITSTLEVLGAKYLVTTVNTVNTEFLELIILVEDVSQYVQVEEGSSPVGAQVSSSYSDDLAYVIFTSGTTGSPKGVMIAAGALFHFAKQKPFNLAVNVSDRAHVVHLF